MTYVRIAMKPMSDITRLVFFGVSSAVQLPPRTFFAALAKASAATDCNCGPMLIFATPMSRKSLTVRKPSNNFIETLSLPSNAFVN